jgi:hypothetical protein
MGATAEIIVAALNLAAALAPSVIKGVTDLIADIEARSNAGTALSLAEVDALSALHGVDLRAIAGVISQSA